MTENCAFCRMIDGTEDPQTEMVFRGNGYLALVPLNPVTSGHVLFVPDQHAERLEQLDGWAIEYTLNGLKFYAEGKGYDYNVIQSNGLDATQTVGHVHFHYVPRWPGDGLKLPWSRSDVAAEEVARIFHETYERLAPKVRVRDQT